VAATLHLFVFFWKVLSFCDSIMHKQVNLQLSKTDSKQKWKLQVSFKVGCCPAPLHRQTILYDTTVIYDISFNKNSSFLVSCIIMPLCQVTAHAQYFLVSGFNPIKCLYVLSIGLEKV